MSRPKSYHLETKNLSCELTLPNEPNKYPVELMFTAFGWHTTIALKPEDFHRLIVFCDKHLKSIEPKTP